MIKIKYPEFLIASAALLSLCWPAAALAGTWELQEDGKRWRYMESPNRAVEDEWIIDDGKEYYVDSNGYMKTGWVTDKNDNKRYYMGEDGAKCYNMYTPDNHYVGPEGTVLESFDTYRKKVTKELEAFLKKKNSEDGKTPGFLLADLNGDEYQDIAVFDDAASPERVLLAAVWDPEEEDMLGLSEMDPDSEEKSCLSFGRESQLAWLTVTEKDGAVNFFSLENGEPHFKNEWSLEIDEDDWGDPVYYVNGDEADFEEWENALETAKSLSGDSLAVNLQALDKESIEQAVNHSLTEEELSLWQQ